jgi:hypothetical protein
VAQDTAKAIELLTAAADGVNLAAAHFILGEIYAPLGQDKQAAFRYGRAANLGMALAQFNYGAMLAIGKGIDKDEAEAGKYFFLACQQQHPMALFVMGDFLEKGRGKVAIDKSRALEYYTDAVKAGNGEAAAAVARLTAEGVTLPEQK